MISAVDNEALKSTLYAFSKMAGDARISAFNDLLKADPNLANALAPYLLELDNEPVAFAAPAALFGEMQNAQLPKQFGLWRVLKEIGRGGMGVVLLAERADGAFAKQVAIKVLPPIFGGGAASSRFARELKALAPLQHPNIARMLDAGEAQSCAYLVMEYVEGIDIKSYVALHKLQPQGVLKLFGELCSAVAFAHGQLIVHRDIKPSNVLVDAAGQAHLLDFGIAKFLQRGVDDVGVADAQSTLTSQFGASYTLAYASPEQLRGDAATVTSDIFNLGLLLYELLANVHPFSVHATVTTAQDGVAKESFKADTVASMMRAVLHQSPARQPLQDAQLPSDLQAIIFKALEKLPAKRYQSVDALWADVEAFKNRQPVKAQAPTWIYFARKFVARNRLEVTATMAAAALILGFSGLALRSANEARAQAALAQERLQAVRALANKVVFDYNQTLAPIDGTLAFRKTIVADALKYLEAQNQQLVSLVSGGTVRDSITAEDLALMQDIARGYEAVGDVQGGGVANSNLGQLDAAKLSYERAVTIRKALCAAQSKLMTRAVAEASTVELSMASSASNTVDAASACTAYALALNRLGDNLFSLGQLEPALATFEVARVINDEQLSNDTGAVLNAVRRSKALDAQYLITQKLAGLSSRQTGAAYAQGTPMAVAQLKVVEQMHIEAATPEQNLKAKDRLRLAHDFLAFRYVGDGDATRALPHAERALRLARELVSAIGGTANKDAEIFLATSASRLAEIHAHLLAHETAIPLLQESILTIKSAHQRDPQDAHLRGRYANIARRVGAALNQIATPGALAINQAVLTEAAAASAQFTPKDGVFYAQHQQVMFELARLEAARGRNAAALNRLTIFPETLPDNPRAAADLAEVFLLRAQIHAAMGKTDTAFAAFKIAQPVLAQAATATPSNALAGTRLADANAWALGVFAKDAAAGTKISSDQALQFSRQAFIAQLKVAQSSLLQQLKQRQQLTPWWQLRLNA